MITKNILKQLQRQLYTSPKLKQEQCDTARQKKGLVIGAYEGCARGEFKFTPTGVKFDQEVNNRISELIKGTDLPLGKAKVINNLSKDFYGVAVAGLGPDSLGYNENEVLDECKEAIRVASGTGARILQDMGCQTIFIEGFTNTEAAAEGSSLSVWRYQDLRSRDNKKIESKVDLYEDPDVDSWVRGVFKAEAQNIARKLEETPANIMTPSNFSQAAIEILCPCGISVDVRDRDWLAERNLTAFLAMARGSCEPPLLLELSYCGGHEDDKPVMLVGKGVTFDSGGLCLLPCPGMDEHRADMAGGAVIVGVLKALASLSIPMNVNALIPLCENMPGGMAMKPGDVVVSWNGKTIKIEYTSHEGRVILSDVLAYSTKFKPCLTINIATLTGGAKAALGSSATPSFSTSQVVWTELEKAGAITGDRVWRLPAWKFFTQRVTELSSVDVDNVGTGKGGESCLGAAFLLEFAPPSDFLHMDIKGTGMLSSGTPPYYRKGLMTGRPTRTLIQFLTQMACPMDKPSPC